MDFDLPPSIPLISSGTNFDYDGYYFNVAASHPTIVQQMKSVLINAVNAWY